MMLVGRHPHAIIPHLWGEGNISKTWEAGHFTFGAVNLLGYELKFANLNRY